MLCGKGKTISKTMLLFLQYRKKQRKTVKRCCYMNCIVRRKGKLKPCCSIRLSVKLLHYICYYMLLYVLYRRDRGIQSLKPCCYYLLNRADKKILLVNLCCNIYCIVRSSVVWMLQKVCIAKIIHQRKEEKIPIMMDDLIHNEGTDECLLN